MTRSIIVAMARNRVIGRDGGLPWHLPADLRFFKQRTMGCWLVLGRRTWESVGKPLPGRQIAVVTRRADVVLPPTVHRVATLDDALALAEGDEVFLAGGAGIYREALERDWVDRIYLTLVEAEPPGDTWFPELDDSRWQVVAEESHPADDRHRHAFTIFTYERAAGSAMR